MSRFPYGRAKVVAPLRLYRDPDRGWLTGVCSGLADYFGVDVVLVRVGTVIAGLIFSWFVVAAYIALALYLPRKPAVDPLTANDAGFWRSMRVHPSQALVELVRRQERLSQRLARLEAEVTSAEFVLREKFRKME